jgi:hypothetical protein
VVRESGAPSIVGAPSTSTVADRAADVTPSSVSTARRVIAGPLASGAKQLKSVALDAAIEQRDAPPAAAVTTTLPPASFVPVRRTALVGENRGALKLKFGVGPIELDGLGAGVGAAPISVIAWIANPAMATAAPIRRCALGRRFALAPRSRNERRETFERGGCTVTPFSTAWWPVSTVRA